MRPRMPGKHATRCARDRSWVTPALAAATAWVTFAAALLSLVATLIALQLL